MVFQSITYANQCFFPFFAPATLKQRKRKFAPREAFTEEQLSGMEEKYLQKQILSDEERTELSVSLDIYPHTRVTTWFKNKRAIQRREADEVKRQMVMNIA